jgi:hypothetical protein
MDTRKVIKLNVAARQFGVPFRWLRQQAEAGKFPAVKADNVFLVLPDAVEQFLVEAAGKLQDVARTLNESRDL